MTRLFAAALVLVSLQAFVYALGQATAAKPIIGPWSKTKTTPLELAKSVDKRLSELQQTVGAYQVWVTLNGNGHSTGDMWIKDSKTFHIEYPDVHYRQTDKDNPLITIFLIADGKTAELNGGKFENRQSPVEKLRLYNAKTVADWVFGYPRFVVAGVHGEHPFTDLIEKASQPTSGYSISIQARDVLAAGMNFPQARILIDRKSGIAHTRGPLRLELVFSTRDDLPVTGTTSEAPPTMAEAIVKCTFGWQHAITPIPEDKFAIAPKSSNRKGTH